MRLMATLLLVTASTGWSVTPSPNVSDQNGLAGVAIVSPGEAWAVGGAYSVINGASQERPLTEHLTGGAWQVVPAPAPSGTATDVLVSVAASSSADAWAVGGNYLPIDARASHPLVEHWNGTAWTMAAVPQQFGLAGFQAVAEGSPTDVWAVGNTGTRPRTGATTIYPLVEHYDGTAWTVVTTPLLTGVSLSGVAERAAGDVWAVGYTGTGQSGVVLHGTGGTWTQVAVPAPPGAVSWQFSGLARAPSGQLWAVGHGTAADGSTHGFAARFDGTTWSVQALPDRGTGYLYNTLSGIAAASDSDVWAGGNAGTGDQRFVTLAEHWNGTAWSVQPTPNVGTADGLDGVATNGTTAWAVGSTGTANTSTFHTLVERNG